jgi:hypothetical protein
MVVLIGKVGSPDWIRTSYLVLRRHALYPNELRDHIDCIPAQTRLSFSGGNNRAAFESYPRITPFLWFDANAEEAVVEADASAGLLNDYAVQTIDLADPTACNVTLSSTSTNAIGSGAPGSVGITAGTGCIYSAVSNASWVQVISGGYGSGNGTLQ